MYRKGQYFSFDAIVASVIFVLALVALLSYWHSVRTYLDYQNSDLARESVRVSGILFMPPSGTCGSTMTRLGFANSWSDRKVDEAVLKCAADPAQMSGEALRANLSTSFNVSIVVYDVNDGKQAYLIGPDPSNLAAREVVKMRRVATVEKSDKSTYLAAIDVYMYR